MEADGIKIGIPREIRNNESRVDLSPSDVHALVESGHTVLMKTNASSGSFFEDVDYKEAGAEIVAEQTKVWDVDMAIKVKEPLESEHPYSRKGLVLFTYLHLTSEEKLTQTLIDKKVIGIVYETVQLPNQSLPLLSPMSKVAGRALTQVGIKFLQKLNGGMGILLGGVSGVPRGRVTIIDDGQAGTNAAKIILGLSTDVMILDVSPERLQQLDDLFGGCVHTVMLNPLDIGLYVKQSDLVIGAVLIPGTKAPRSITEDMTKQIGNGSVIADTAIDWDGILEITGKIIIHDNPTYIKHGVVHYAVADMPGTVPCASTLTLNNATLPYALMLTNKGYREAFKSNQSLSLGLSTYKGHVINEGTAETLGMEYKSAEKVLQL